VCQNVLALCGETIKARGFQEHITYEGTAFEEQDSPQSKKSSYQNKQLTIDIGFIRFAWNCVSECSRSLW
jgi:hypothetical protein